MNFFKANRKIIAVIVFLTLFIISLSIPANIGLFLARSNAEGVNNNENLHSQVTYITEWQDHSNYYRLIKINNYFLYLGAGSPWPPFTWYWIDNDGNLKNVSGYWSIPLGRGFIYNSDLFKRYKANNTYLNIISDLNESYFREWFIVTKNKTIGITHCYINFYAQINSVPNMTEDVLDYYNESNKNITPPIEVSRKLIINTTNVSSPFNAIRIVNSTINKFGINRDPAKTVIILDGIFIYPSYLLNATYNTTYDDVWEFWLTVYFNVTEVPNLREPNQYVNRTFFFFLTDLYGDIISYKRSSRYYNTSDPLYLMQNASKFYTNKTGYNTADTLQNWGITVFLIEMLLVVITITIVQLTKLNRKKYKHNIVR